MTLLRNLVLAILLVLIASGAMAGQPWLRKSEAIRIANIKAKSTGHDLRRYQCGPVNYEEREDVWWVNYRAKNGRYTEFTIQVEDKSKKAWLALP